MGCFVQGEKSVWDLLSTSSNQCRMFCPPRRSSVGSFVHPAKNGMGAFVHGIFCPAPVMVGRKNFLSRFREASTGVGLGLCVPGRVENRVCESY